MIYVLSKIKKSTKKKEENVNGCKILSIFHGQVSIIKDDVISEIPPQKM